MPCYSAMLLPRYRPQPSRYSPPLAYVLLDSLYSDKCSLPAGLFLSHFADFEVLQLDQLLDAISDDPGAVLGVALSGTNVIPVERVQASILAGILQQHPGLVAFS